MSLLIGSDESPNSRAKSVLIGSMKTFPADASWKLKIGTALAPLRTLSSRQCEHELSGNTQTQAKQNRDGRNQFLERTKGVSVWSPLSPRRYRVSVLSGWACYFHFPSASRAVFVLYNYSQAYSYCTIFMCNAVGGKRELKLDTVSSCYHPPPPGPAPFSSLAFSFTMPLFLSFSMLFSLLPCFLFDCTLSFFFVIHVRYEGKSQELKILPFQSFSTLMN